ncbi:HNH endonuclease signature motif containing protein [Nocardioides marmoraquaticus]
MARTPNDTPTTMGSVAGTGESCDDVPRHPVAEFTTRLRHRLDQLTAPTARPVWAMRTEELAGALLDLATAQAQLDALRLSVLAEAERNGSVLAPGDRTIADWYARETRTRRNLARADLRLARATDDAMPALAAGMASGVVSLDQARAIKRSVDLLPTSGEFAVDGDQRDAAEAHLVALAAHHDSADLDHLGRRMYAVIAPEAADAYEGRLLEAEEARAARKTVLETWTDHQGLTHGRFRIPRLHGAMLKKALDAIMSPLRDTTSSLEPGNSSIGPALSSSVEPVETPVGTTDPHDTRPITVRRGEAFCELLERLSARDLPVTAGGDATIVVTLRHDDLVADLDTAGVATLDTGHRISAAQARRLACRHQLLPAVLDGASRVLDLGRARRLHTKAQRLALSIGQGGCTAEHCDVPAAKCHAHHDTPWSEGGDTSLANGRLLCGPHHRRVHDPAYHHERLPDGTLRFHRRP